MIIDNVSIYVKAGDGGNGCVAFHREKYISHGGPDGGDGGNGGNIILEVAPGDNTLLKYKYKHKFVAQNGDNGQNSKFHGKTADDMILPVPEGTVVKDKKTGKVIIDMSDCKRFVLCRGGRGGWGNQHFATPTRQIPRFAKSGITGEEREVILELKMLADVGLVGMPNAGKSSILSIISDAKPKIADYHFTTLSPNLGVVRTGEGTGFVAADIPGLIEGASEGAGLGHEFLRHIDRCRLIIHVVDISCFEGNNPVNDLKIIDEELSKYSEELGKRPQIVVANKSDILDEQLFDREEFENYVKSLGRQLIYVSAATGENIDKMIKLADENLKKLPPIKIYETEYDITQLPIQSTSHDTVIRNENGVYVIEGDWLYKVMGSVNFDDHESLMYFQRVLKNSGVIDALIEKGAKDGDTVSIYDFKFDFIR